MNMVNALLIASNLLVSLQGEANNVDDNLHSKLHSSKTLQRQKAILYALECLQCLTCVSIPLPKRTNIAPKTVDYIVIEYAENTSAYRKSIIEL